MKTQAVAVIVPGDTGRIGRELLMQNAWEGVDSAVSMLESVAAEQRR